MQKTREEILEMMKNAKSWREFGLSIKEVYEAFLSDSSDGYTKHEKVHGEQTERASMPVREPQTKESDVVRDLREKNARLIATNKQLRMENKELRGGAKK